ncbi:hypothetical protein FGO68_gene1711 [Halteria grandinella]|uniref:Uncharacterized protein n=1 Tax=Halteria grandinella TaxID=5974 RepID=A0A8J8NI06_HALGN|nr:hypothetical protein FGO68_gene1711 [Halteria grandinella]
MMYLNFLLRSNMKNCSRFKHTIDIQCKLSKTLQNIFNDLYIFNLFQQYNVLLFNYLLYYILLFPLLSSKGFQSKVYPISSNQ